MKLQSITITPAELTETFSYSSQNILCKILSNFPFMLFLFASAVTEHRWALARHVYRLLKDSGDAS